MKKILHGCLAILASLVFIGCGGKPQFLKVPTVQQTPTDFQIGRSALLDATNHTVGFLDENKNVLYYQTFGGGGVTLGLLLGPLGVAANISAIESQTKEDLAALNGKFALDPVALFAQSHADTGLNIREGNSPTLAEITPYFYVTKGENEVLLMASSILVDYNKLGFNWVGKYMTQLPLTFTKQKVAEGLSAEELQELKVAIVNGYKESIKLYQLDKSDQLPSLKSVTFTSEFASPRFNFEMLGESIESDEKQTNIRTVGAVYSFPKEMVKILKSSPISSK